MTARYYVPPPLAAGPCRLEGPEAHHLLHVMRTQVGDEVTLFDGQGGEAAAIVAQCGRSDATLDVQEILRVDRELTRPLHLGVSLPKGDRQKWLVEKCVELGVTSLTPLVTRRSVAQPTGNAIQRLSRSVIEASKQCGRNTLMELAPSVELEAWLEAAPAAAAKFLADPSAETGPPAPADEPIYATIGPEGGFTDEELAAARRRWTLVSLGPRILRVETAAVALAALVAWRDA